MEQSWATFARSAIRTPRRTRCWRGTSVKVCAWASAASWSPAVARERLLSAVNGARDRVVFTEGGQDPREQLSFLRKLFAAARAAGERVRVAGCMRWALAKGYSLEQVMEYEARLDALIRRYSASVLCVYHVGHFSSDAVRRALKTHPDAVRHPLVAA